MLVSCASKAQSLDERRKRGAPDPARPIVTEDGSQQAADLRKRHKADAVPESHQTADSDKLPQAVNDIKCLWIDSGKEIHQKSVDACLMILTRIME